MEYKIKKASYDELYHYGTPGMKWGVRKQRVPLGNGRIVKKQPIQNKSSNVTKQKTTNKKRQSPSKTKKSGAAKVGKVLSYSGKTAFSIATQDARKQYAYAKLTTDFLQTPYAKQQIGSKLNGLEQDRSLSSLLLNGSQPTYKYKPPKI